MESMKLSEIAMACGGTLEGKDSEISNISTDTRTIEQGSLFVAVKGENFDGHEFCAKAQENGASAVFVCEEVSCSLPKVKVDDTRLAQLNLAGYYRRKFNIPVVGVTGSVGKTTTKEMIYSVLSGEYKTLKTQGNFNNDIGLPKMIFQLDKSYEAAVFEMGMSDLGEISVLSKAAQPTVSIISNIGVSHLENLKTRDNILKAKLEIIDGMDEKAPLIINLDNDMLKNINLENRTILTFAIEDKNADYVAENITYNGDKMAFDIVCKDGIYKAEIPTVGIHNVYNALAAFAVGDCIGIERQKCAKNLLNYAPSGMRQNIRRQQGIIFIEDCYNASPDSQKASLNALMDIEAKRHIAVLGDMLELGSISKQAHYDVGKYASAKNIDMLFCYGKEAEHIYDAAKENGLEDVFFFDDKIELSEKLLSVLSPGDAISFKASRGMKLEEVIKNIYKGMGIKDE